MLSLPYFDAAFSREVVEGQAQTYQLKYTSVWDCQIPSIIDVEIESNSLEYLRAMLFDLIIASTVLAKHTKQGIWQPPSTLHVHINEHLEKIIESNDRTYRRSAHP